MTDKQDKIREAFEEWFESKWGHSLKTTTMHECFLECWQAAYTHLSEENARLQKREAELVDALRHCKAAMMGYGYYPDIAAAYTHSLEVLANHQKKGE